MDHPNHPSTLGSHKNATNNALKKCRVDLCVVPIYPFASTKFSNQLFLTAPSDPELIKWFQAEEG